jgi:hypothetical protein
MESETLDYAPAWATITDGFAADPKDTGRVAACSAMVHKCGPRRAAQRRAASAAR